jgi:hypothetical protein
LRRRGRLSKIFNKNTKFQVIENYSEVVVAPLAQMCLLGAVFGLLAPQIGLLGFKVTKHYRNSRQFNCHRKMDGPTPELFVLNLLQ